MCARARQEEPEHAPLLFVQYALCLRRTGARSGNRTRKRLPSGGFKPPASACSAIRARTYLGYARRGVVVLYCMGGIRHFNRELQHGAPQLGAGPVSFGGLETVDEYDTFDHVANSSREWPVRQAHSDDAAFTITRTPDAAIDTHNARRTAKPWHHKIKFGCTLGQHPGCCCEL